MTHTERKFSHGQITERRDESPQTTTAGVDIEISPGSAFVNSSESPALGGQKLRVKFFSKPASIIASPAKTKSLLKLNSTSRALKRLGSLCPEKIAELEVNPEMEMIKNGSKEVTIEQNAVRTPAHSGKNIISDASDLRQDIKFVMKAVEAKNNADHKILFQDYDFLKVNQQMLNELDIQDIQREYAKKSAMISDVDYNHVDYIVRQIKFFSHLSQRVRLEILRNASYEYYPAKTTLFREGDVASKVYIILRGSVNVRAKRSSFLGVIGDVLITVLYDGTCFGNYAVMGLQPQKEAFTMADLKSTKGHSASVVEETEKARSSPSIIKNGADKFQNSMGSSIEMTDRTLQHQDELEIMGHIETAENCDVLAVDKRHFESIFIYMVQKEIDLKLRILKMLSCFQGLDVFHLVPIANFLVPKVYHYKEVIMTKGDLVDKLRIVARGRCGLVMTTERSICLEVPTTIKGRVSDLKGFKCGLTDYPGQKSPSSWDEEKKALQEKIKELSDRFSVRLFDYDQVELKENSIIYIENVPFGVISEGEIFGGRSLLKEGDLDQNSQDGQYNVQQMTIHEPARLTVVAETTDVEILELDRGNFMSLPDFLQDMLKSGIKLLKEFDDYNITKEQIKIADWRKLKMKEIKDTYKSIPRPYGSRYKKF